MIQLTQSAITEIKKLLEQQNDPNLGLRIGVFSGGCSGVSYRLSFDQKNDFDLVQEFDGLKVFTNRDSEAMLDGTSIDFIDNSEGRGFQVTNPKAEKEPGCGGCRGCGPASQ